jgi:hypothetical protein
MMSDNFIVNVGDAISLTVLFGWLVSALPAVATLLTIVWTALRIYEMCTVQRWLNRKKKNEPSS